MILGPVQRSVQSKAQGRRHVNHLRLTTERMDPLDAVDWLLEVIAASQPDDELEGLIHLMDWGFTRQQAHFLRILLATGKAGASYERLAWELSCNGEPSSRATARVVAANVRRRLVQLGWPVKLINMHSRGYLATHAAGWVVPIKGEPARTWDADQNLYPDSHC